MIPLVPVLMVIALQIAGVESHYVALLPLPVMCLFLGWTMHNDVAYDSTAIWLHIVSGTHGAADRFGRLFPVLLIGIPLVVVGSFITAAVYGDWAVLGAVAGVGCALLLVGAGLSSVSSALFPYPATKPGQSAFTQPQTSGGSAALVQSVSFLAILLVSSPVIVFMLLGILLDPMWLTWAFVSGIVIGVAAVWAGIYVGGIVFERRAPKLMAFATRNG